jgi:hypothetical protein
MIKYIDDLLVFIGCALILYATYLLSPIAALYVGGIISVLAGLGISLFGGKKAK